MILTLNYSAPSYNLVFKQESSPPTYLEERHRRLFRWTCHFKLWALYKWINAAINSRVVRVIVVSYSITGTVNGSKASTWNKSPTTPDQPIQSQKGNSIPFHKIFHSPYTIPSVHLSTAETCWFSLDQRMVVFTFGIRSRAPKWQGCRLF